ncbi:hypothetical protein PZ895_08490 [Mesorhizobium sp. YIM 152430]|uniref:hypothetical protein n=1 Tax=Mesorhizobium sp. YIM 152430 TaxID=3031761 RepID=UPI0023D9E2CB|nr:hypothetical protein [Mesorhizobium sp. YIM 152430]MDF1599814.1 hypothetical protein [Mesorhizobium sp. YIM 152430]
MSDREDLELRLMRIERTQALMLEKLDRLAIAPGAMAPAMGAPAAFAASGKRADNASPARSSRFESGLSALGTIALVLVAIAALIWIGDELHLNRYVARMFW